ncbi:hypothetical protein M885DRAFT_505302 [Pelagophyceae sp. CCMP2097]|nr:hypothetical protein M885DRAFT_505302 [Pelagophyceae sp. CCMP2097]
MSRRRGGLITTPPKRMRGPARTTSAYFDPVKTEVKGGVEDEVEAEVEGKITEVKAEIEGQIEIKAEDAFFKGSFAPVLHHTVAPHTLLLGTQPSDNSLAQGWYFATNSNAFWHIVGDALGFRASRAGAPFARWPYKRLGRGFHVGRVDAVDFIRPHLLHSESESLSYDAALQRLTSSGYAMWDVVSSSNRKGSLDSAIKQATFSDVESLVAFNPTIKRICFSTGSGSANMFRKAHKQWLREPGAFRARDDDASRAVFGKFVCGTGTARIELCVRRANPGLPGWIRRARGSRRLRGHVAPR